MVKNLKENRIYFLGLLGSFALGLGLRAYLLRSQILLDDEWHGIDFIYNKSFLQVFTQINPYENSSPLLNLYAFLVYHTIGISEWNLRLPLLMAGSALVIIFPLLVRRVFSARAGILFSLLLALSPFLIFYSRFFRAYAFVVLISFCSLVMAYRWITLNKTRYAIGFILANIAAVYIHPSAIAAAPAPYVLLIFAQMFKRLQTAATERVNVPRMRFLAVMFVHGISIALVTYGYFSNRNVMRSSVNGLTGAQAFNTLQLICGSASPAVLIAFFVLALLGVWKSFRTAPYLAAVLCIASLCAVAFVCVTQPLGIECSEVFLRYCIIIIPILLLFVALGADALLSVLQSGLPDNLWLKTARGACIAAGGCLLFGKGPLPVIYKAPNNFTNHLAYQGAYDYQGWTKSRSNHYYPSYEISRDDIPAFYKSLATNASARAVIEYPFDFADHSDLDYFYQIYHRKRVFAGFCSQEGRIGGAVTPEMSQRLHDEQLVVAVDRPELSLPPSALRGNTHFRNLIDISDDSSLEKCGADYVILHKTIETVYVGAESMGTCQVHDKSVDYFTTHFKQFFGPPVFEDDRIIVFPLNKH